MLRNSTRILVTHHISVLPKCDFILVMRNGTIVETGTYEQLMNNGHKGEFAELLRSKLESNNNKNTEKTNEEVGSKSSNNGSFSSLHRESEDNSFNSLETELYKAIENIDETDLFLSRCFKEIDELSIEEESYCSIVKPKTNKQPFHDINLSPSSKNSSFSLPDYSNSVSSTISRCTNKTDSLTKILPTKEIHNAQPIQPEAMETSHQITTQEKSATDSIKLSFYWNYFKRIGLWAAAATIATQLCILGCNIAASEWLANWSNEADQHSNITETENENLKNLAIYISLGLGEYFFTLFTTLIISFFTLRAAKLLHQDMLARLLRAQMLFFETNPIDRILNRFSRDIDICDTILNMNLLIAVFTSFRTIAAILVIAIDTPFVLIAVFLLLIIFFIIQKMYLPTSRQLQRIESTTRSSVYSHFSETLSGVSTIRAFRKQKTFIMESNRRIDQNNVVTFAVNSATQWIAVRLEFLGYMLVFANALYCLIERDIIKASIAGLTLTYSMTITTNLNNFIMSTSELENSIVSFERCLEYTNLETEVSFTKIIHIIVIIYNLSQG